MRIGRFYWEILPTAPLPLSRKQLHLRGTIRCLLAPFTLHKNSALSGQFSAVKGLAFCLGSIDHALKPGNEWLSSATVWNFQSCQYRKPTKIYFLSFSSGAHHQWIMIHKILNKNDDSRPLIGSSCPPLRVVLVGVINHLPDTVRFFNRFIVKYWHVDKQNTEILTGLLVVCMLNILYCFIPVSAVIITIITGRRYVKP